MDDFDELGPVGCAFMLIILVVVIVIMAVASDPKPEPENTPVDISVQNWTPDPSVEIIDKNK